MACFEGGLQRRSLAFPCDGSPASRPLARRPRAKEDQAKAEHELRSAGRARNGNYPARFDQNALIRDHFLVLFCRKREVRPNYRDDARNDQENPKYRVKGDLQAGPAPSTSSRESSFSVARLHEETAAVGPELTACLADRLTADLGPGISVSPRPNTADGRARPRASCSSRASPPALARRRS